LLRGCHVITNPRHLFCITSSPTHATSVTETEAGRGPHQSGEDAQKAVKEAQKEVDAESDGESDDDEDGLTGSLAAGAGLMGRKRGGTVEVKVKGKYNARGYLWRDVIATCEKLESVEWKLSWLNPDHKHHV